MDMGTAPPCRTAVARRVEPSARSALAWRSTTCVSGCRGGAQAALASSEACGRPTPSAPARARHATFVWVSSAPAVARGLGGNGRATALCFVPQQR